MDRLIYTSLTAMRGAMARQTTTASNLANANTTGFRAEIANVQSLWMTGGPEHGRVLASEEVLAANMDAGTVATTGRALDIALSGDALLAVQARDGEEGYTRRGDLMLSDSGLLTTGDGAPVLGEGGPVTLPPSDSIKIEADGSIWVVLEGGDPTQPQQVEKLKLVSPTGSEVVKHVDGLFRVSGGGTLPSDPDGRLTAGALEGSNVNATQALVDMIDASRAWETQIKLLTAAREIDDAGAKLMQLQ